jgi:glutamate-1-semialdehyde 2,1-aminomutase
MSRSGENYMLVGEGNPELEDRAADLVRAALPKSAARYDALRDTIPGATTRPRFWWPFPPFADRGEGAHLWDIDDNRYVDVNMAFGPLLLGHRPPEVIKALEAQLERGVFFGAGCVAEGDLALLVAEHVPGAERVLWVNSGTEATLTAVRLARTATGKTKAAKFEGGWHGWHEFLFHNFRSVVGEPANVVTTADTLGVPDGVVDSVVALPYNDPLAFDRIRREAHDLACVVVEGVQGAAGSMPANAEWLRELRALCQELGIIFILDEVITGFRLGAGGAAAVYDITPDLTALGKIIGGGLAAGALTGRADLLDRVLPDADGKSVVVAGTFSGSSMTMEAGLAQLTEVTTNPALYPRLEALGDRMRAGIAAAAATEGVTAHVTGMGSMWGIHFTEEEPHSVRGQQEAHPTAARLLSAYLLLVGVLMTNPAHLGFVSTRHTDADVDAVVEAHRRVFARMKDEGAFA